jgi:hypothetical protein
VNAAIDVNNCGACGNVCAAGQSCCGGVCADLQTSSANCGACGHPCAAGQSCCSGACTSLSSDENNCGACGNVCPGANGTPFCLRGRCDIVCHFSYSYCGGVCVFEPSDPSNCGGCGNICTYPNIYCVHGVCSPCPDGLTECAGACVNTATDRANCGVCGHVCRVANGTAACSNSVCIVASCSSGYGDCDKDASNGCETDLNPDVNNCGACGNVCPARPNGTAACSSGTCGVTCSSGFGNCDGDPTNGCEVNMNTDVNNCGACGHVCNVPNGTAGCSNGFCIVARCNSGYTNCGGSCVDLLTDVHHCGSCGMSCNEFEGICLGGTCTQPVGI